MKNNKKILMLCLACLFLPLLVIAETAYVKLNPGDYRIAGQSFFDRPQEDVKKDIIANIENINVIFDENFGGTFLHFASTNGTPEILKFILDNGADIEALDCFSHTPLCGAAMMGRDDSVKILLEYGADPNYTYINRKPIHLALSGYISVLLSDISERKNNYISKVDKLPEEKPWRKRTVQNRGLMIKLLWPVTELKENELEIWKKEFSSDLKSELTKPEIEKEWNKFLSLIK